WKYGDDALRNFKKYDLLRYRLFPYLYTTMHQQYQTGVPMMRALVLDNQEDENVYEIADQYMFGDNMMIAPVTTKGAITRSVYLPKGIWFNYWTNEKYEGKTNHHVVAPLDTLPIFVKGGSIIPMQPEMRFAGEKPVDVITLAIFPYGKSSYELYEDDNLSLQYQKGNFAKTKITANLTGSNLAINIDKPLGMFTPTSHHYLTEIRWTGEVPNSITENGKKISALSNKNELDNNAGWFFDAKTKMLLIKTANKNNTAIQLNIN
ncbi:MAG: DUF5110 domain-containing protein, partial [Pedobacter sp.]